MSNYLDSYIHSGLSNVKISSVKPNKMQKKSYSKLLKQEIEKNKGFVCGVAAVVGVTAIAIGGILLHRKLNTQAVEVLKTKTSKIIKKVYKDKIMAMEYYSLSEGAQDTLQRIDKGIVQNSDGSTFIKKIILFGKNKKVSGVISGLKSNVDGSGSLNSVVVYKNKVIETTISGLTMESDGTVKAKQLVKHCGDKQTVFLGITWPKTGAKPIIENKEQIDMSQFPYNTDWLSDLIIMAL